MFDGIFSNQEIYLLQTSPAYMYFSAVAAKITFKAPKGNDTIFGGSLIKLLMPITNLM